MSNALNMEERLEPRFVKFGDGETVAGVLISIEVAQVNGKSAARYTVEDLDSGERTCFLGTAQINSKLRKSDVGHAIEVRCEGTDKSVIKNGNAMKLFRVKVSKEKVSDDSLLITDADIPF